MLFATTNEFLRAQWVPSGLMYPACDCSVLVRSYLKSVKSRSVVTSSLTPYKDRIDENKKVVIRVKDGLDAALRDGHVAHDNLQLPHIRCRRCPKPNPSTATLAHMLSLLFLSSRFSCLLSALLCRGTTVVEKCTLRVSSTVVLPVRRRSSSSGFGGESGYSLHRRPCRLLAFGVASLRAQIMSISLCNQKRLANPHIWT